MFRTKKQKSNKLKAKVNLVWNKKIPIFTMGIFLFNLFSFNLYHFIYHFILSGRLKKRQ